MRAMEYIVYGIALFFAASWTFALSVPRYRLKSNICAIAFWWLEIGLALTGAFSSLHLFWLMPVSFFVSMNSMLIDLGRRGRTSLSSIMLKSTIVIAPAIGALLYLSAPTGW
jgi:hypothetical protein